MPEVLTEPLLTLPDSCSCCYKTVPSNCTLVFEPHPDQVRCSGLSVVSKSLQGVKLGFTDTLPQARADHLSKFRRNHLFIFPTHSSLLLGTQQHSLAVEGAVLGSRAKNGTGLTSGSSPPGVPGRRTSWVLAERASRQEHPQLGSMNCVLLLCPAGTSSCCGGQGACAFDAFDRGGEAAAGLALGETVGLTLTPNELLQSKPPTN